MALLLAGLFFGGCKKFLDIDLPSDTIAGQDAFVTDVSASGVVSGIFSSMLSNTYFTSNSISLKAGLYADELRNLDVNASNNEAFYKNALDPSFISQWQGLYRDIYKCNIAIKGVRAGSNLVYANQWLGESLVSRAYLYFYLVNLFGDVPLALSPDYETNNKLIRSPKTEVYQQIVKDLQEAQSLLSLNYSDGFGQSTTTRGRPNRYAATALLARIYLYTGEWAKAEAEASTVIGAGTAVFDLVPLANVFLANSKETIWALAPPATGLAPDYNLYNAGAAGTVATPAALLVKTPLSQSMINSFEAGDARLTAWIRTTTTTTPAGIYYYPNKYRSATPGAEYHIALRLGEQYLIRAEARARLNNISGSVQDLNAIRTRSRSTAPGVLPDYASAISQDECLAAVAKERRTELFTEFGSRFFDLKRTGAVDQVMTAEVVAKGAAVWSSQKQLWPIRVEDIRLNPNLTQTPGY